MKKRRQFIQMLFIAGFLFAAVTACDKSDDPGGDTLKDADGNVYKTVKIGDQVWMAENLKTTKYNDGTVITNVTSNTQWSNLKTGGYCNYGNIEGNVAIYGRLYNWYAVKTGKLAPAGWHVSTLEDWTALENYLIANGYNYDGTSGLDKVAKSLCSKTGWASSTEVGTPGTNPDGNNRTGFTALPGGYRYNNGEFNYLDLYGYWWCSDELISNDALYLFMGCGFSSLDSGIDFKEYGYSVRLVKD